VLGNPERQAQPGAEAAARVSSAQAKRNPERQAQLRAEAAARVSSAQAKRNPERQAQPGAATEGFVRPLPDRPLHASSRATWHATNMRGRTIGRDTFLTQGTLSGSTHLPDVLPFP